MLGHNDPSRRHLYHLRLDYHCQRCYVPVDGITVWRWLLRPMVRAECRRTVVRTEKGKLADACEISVGICKIVELKVRTVSSKISSGVLSWQNRDFGERFRHHLDSQLTLLTPDDEVSAGDKW